MQMRVSSKNFERYSLIQLGKIYSPPLLFERISVHQAPKNWYKLIVVDARIQEPHRPFDRRGAKIKEQPFQDQRALLTEETTFSFNS